MEAMVSTSQINRQPGDHSQDSQAVLLALYAEHGDGLVSAAGRAHPRALNLAPLTNDVQTGTAFLAKQPVTTEEPHQVKWKKQLQSQVGTRVNRH